MMQYRITNLVLHNFKLFDDADINFDSRSLTVLDGPNGYGKTSVFDAIEYVLTGTIHRAADRKELNNALAYDNNFITKVPSDGTLAYAQATFHAEVEDTILIIRRTLQDASGRANNPKQLSNNTVTTITHEGNVVFENVDVQTANSVISGFLGQNVLRYFDQYYYISQEDRISFLSKSEKERMGTLQHLFNMENEEEQYAKLRDLKKKFGDLKNGLQTNLQGMQNQIDELEKQTTVHSIKESPEVVYDRLVPTASRLFVWDKEKPQIGEQKKLQELQEQVRGVFSFTRHFQSFLGAQKNEWLTSIEQDPLGLHQFLLLLNYLPEVQSFFSETDRHLKLEKIIVDARLDNDIPEYESIDFSTLSKLLSISYDPGEVLSICEKIQHLKSNIKVEDKARAALTQLHEQMEKKRLDWLVNRYPGLKDNECPFCGYSWDSAMLLKQSIDKIHDGLAVGLTQTQYALNVEQKRLKAIYENTFQAALKSEIQTHSFLNTDTCKNLYKEWKTQIIKFKGFLSKCVEYQIDVTPYCLTKENPDLWDKQIALFLEQVLRPSMLTLPTTYTDEATKYNFAGIYHDVYTDETARVFPIDEIKFQNKLMYLELQYFVMQSDKLAKLREQGKQIKERHERAKRIHIQLSRLEEIVKDALQEYKKQVVIQLQIPFYLYTGRIIQNYPGGLGILISVQGAERIHFEAFDRRGHDVLYTLSSGQLSALAMALTLTLNRIYAQDTYRCILIDDPIQTMDELNVSSFVELLRNDFQSYQFVISTHEDDFSDYIRYKFEKYGLSNKSIVMRYLNKQV